MKLPAESKKNRVLKRVGIFGGTFNPIHVGHLQAARVLRERFSLENVLFVPAAIPPHKSPVGVAPAGDRLAMIELAILDQPGFGVSDVELRRNGPSYSIDTVAHFQAEASGDTRHYLVLGLDAFLELDTWKSYQALIRRIPLVVLARPETRSDTKEMARAQILEFLKKKISSTYAFSPETGCFQCAGHPPLHVVHGGMRMLSATAVREKIFRGADVANLLPPRVGAFIRKKGLYR